MGGFLNQGLELPLFVLFVGLAEDHREHRQGEVVVIVMGFLAGQQGLADRGNPGLPVQPKGVRDRFGGVAEALADRGEGVAKAGEFLGIKFQDRRPHLVHQETPETGRTDERAGRTKTWAS